MGRNSNSRNFIRMPPDVREAADYMMQWALRESAADLTTSPLSAAIHLVSCNLREAAQSAKEAGSDGRLTRYGVRCVAVHPQHGDYEAVGPWVYGLEGMSAVWEYVSGVAQQLYEGMPALPPELSAADLGERTNTARVAMSRRLDGVAVIRVRFTYQRCFEVGQVYPKGYEGPKERKTTWSPQPAQLNIWIGPEHAAQALDNAERAAHHVLYDPAMYTV